MTSVIPLQCSLSTKLPSQLGAGHLVLPHIGNLIFYCKRRQNVIHTAHHYSLFLSSFILLIHVAHPHLTITNGCHITPLPSYNGHLYTTGTFPHPQSGHCEEVQLYLLNMSKSEKVQRRATKFILKTEHNYETRLKKLNLMSLKNRRFLTDVTFLYKALNG